MQIFLARDLKAQLGAQNNDCWLLSQTPVAFFVVESFQSCHQKTRKQILANEGSLRIITILPFLSLLLTPAPAVNLLCDRFL